jgi:hypothetical protein
MLVVKETSRVNSNVNLSMDKTMRDGSAVWQIFSFLMFRGYDQDVN